MTINSGLKLHHPLHSKPSNPESIKTGKPLEKAAKNQVIININKVIRNGNKSVHTDEIEKQIIITIKDEQKLKHYKKFGLEIDDKKYELGQIDTIYQGHERENEADRIRGRFARNLANGGVHLEIRTATESSKKSKYDSIRNSKKLHVIEVKKEENSNNKETDNNNRLRELTPPLSSNSPTPSPTYEENRNSDVENTPDLADPLSSPELSADSHDDVSDTDDSLQSLDDDFEDQDPPELDRWGGAQASLMYGFDLESFYAEASDESEDDNSDTDEDHDVENEDIGRDVMPPMDIAKLISVEEKGIPMEDDFDVSRLSDEEKIEEIDNYIDTILNIMQSSHGLRAC